MTARRQDSTQDALTDSQLGEDAGASSRAEPGLVLIFASGQPVCRLLPLGAVPSVLGRGQGVLAGYEDAQMSRQHAQVAFTGARFEISDLGSRNGSALDGVPLQGATAAASGQLLRCGQTLFLFCADLRPFRELGIKAEARRVEGPALQQAMRLVAHFAGFSRTLFINGESGAGKEALAHAFHRASPSPGGPLVAVNCAAIPEGVAERLLFGTKKGAFSGAVSDSPGYLDAADGGTLFLDEIAELDPSVQGKLLRVIESGELLPLGATRPKKVQLRVCAATHRDLREQAESGRFRADLYFRIGMPQVTVPSLRDRKEEIPFLIAQTVQAAAPDLAVDVSLVEACLLRGWPGNVRELNAEVSAAALTARAAGKALLTATQLRRTAGAMLQRTSSPDRGGQAQARPVPAAFEAPERSSVPLNPDPDESTESPHPDAAFPGDTILPTEIPDRPQILAALLEEGFNVAASARRLRLQRTQLRRLLARYGIDVGKLRAVRRSAR